MMPLTARCNMLCQYTATCLYRCRGSHNPWVCQSFCKHCTIFPIVKHFSTLMKEAVNCDEALKWSKFSPYYAVCYLEDSNVHRYGNGSLKSRINLINFPQRAMIMIFLWRKPDSISIHSIKNLLWTRRHLDTSVLESLTFWTRNYFFSFSTSCI